MIAKRFGQRVAVLSMAGFIGLATPSFAAKAVVALLSSESGPYQDAVAGLKEVCSMPVKVMNVSRGDFVVPHDGAIVVAFGGKAALLSENYDGTLIYGLAPGVQLHPGKRAGLLVKVHTSPAVPIVVAKYKEIQPSLKHLAVLWMGDSIADYFQGTDAIRSSTGVELISVRLRFLDELPQQLRALQQKADAIWMPPDAGLVTPESFAAVREFCFAQRIAFYVPSDGLVEKGATASVYTSFRDLGRLAGQLANQAGDGTLNEKTVVFPEKSAVAINQNAAARIGLQVSPDVLRKADRLIQ